MASLPLLAAALGIFLRPAALADHEGKNDGSAFRGAEVAGVSVSPKGFLAVLQSTANIKGEQSTVAFPVLLTSAGNPPTSDKNDQTINATLPELFRDNADQTSVTSPEALTFLQLLNGVDMATPILPPDTLSLICVWYAFLSEEYNLGGGGDALVVEDELGLSDSRGEDATIDDRGEDESGEALEYIRAMVRTSMPPKKDGSYYPSYMEASPWQRSKIQLPRAWLHGVRLEEVDVSSELDMSAEIGRVPVQFVLECSVDDGTKRLEVPLLAMPASGEETAMPPPLQQQLEFSNDILQELSLNFNGEASAAFMSLALFHRYNKSVEGSADSPVLRLSEGLMQQLVELQNDGASRYCWIAPAIDDANIDNAVQSNGLPLYRTLSQVQEEDQRVLNHLEQQNFGKNPDADSGNENVSSAESSTTPSTPPKKSLTLEQQALQQRLKSAWKIAVQKEDAGALEKIQKAMEDLERDVMENADEEETVEESALQKIQQAMQQSGGDEPQRRRFKEEEGEDEVGLISDLEEATSMRVEEMDVEDEKD
ncbi:hypothetical protein ACHAXT_002715 [Thalassiosira profunda]